MTGHWMIRLLGARVAFRFFGEPYALAPYGRGVVLDLLEPASALLAKHSSGSALKRPFFP